MKHALSRAFERMTPCWIISQYAAARSRLRVARVLRRRRGEGVDHKVPLAVEFRIDFKYGGALPPPLLGPRSHQMPRTRPYREREKVLADPLHGVERDAAERREREDR